MVELWVFKTLFRNDWKKVMKVNLGLFMFKLLFLVQLATAECAESLDDEKEFVGLIPRQSTLDNQDTMIPIRFST